MQTNGSRKLLTLLVVIVITSQCCCCIVTPVSRGGVSLDGGPTLTVQALPGAVWQAVEDFFVQRAPAGQAAAPNVP